MLKNRKETIDKVAIKMFGKLDIAKVSTFTQNHACSYFEDATIVDTTFNNLSCTIINTIVLNDSLNAKEVGILKAVSTMTAYAVALYYGKYLQFPNELDAINDCIEILETIDSNLESIKNKVFGDIDTCKKLIDEIGKEKVSLIEKINFANESEETENNIINSLFT